jgi:hypothetical protein
MIPPGWVSLRAAFTKTCAAIGRGPQVAPEAAGRLLYLLIEGRLQTCTLTPDGSKANLALEYWKSQAETFARDILDFDAFPGVVLNEDELRLSLVKAGDAASSDEPSPDTPNARRGRRPAANPYNIAWVVGSLVYADAWGTSQEDMLTKIAERYEAEFGENSAPSRTTLQPMVRRLLAEMARHDNEVNKRSAKARK